MVPDTPVTCGPGEHVGPPPLPIHDPMALERAAGMLRAAGDPSRLALLDLLAQHERCVSDIAGLLDESLPTISQRLKVLRTEGLVTARRDGKHVYYRLADQHVADLILAVLLHATEGTARAA